MIIQGSIEFPIGSVLDVRDADSGDTCRALVRRRLTRDEFRALAKRMPDLDVAAAERKAQHNTHFYELAAD